MSYDSYRETLDQQEKKQEEILALKQSFNKEMIKLKEQITKDVKKEVYQYFKRRIAYGWERVLQPQVENFLLFR